MINFDFVDAMLVTKRENVRYLTGFTGSAGVLVMLPHKKYLVTDFRYKEQAEIQAKQCGIVIISKDYGHEISKIVSENSIKTLGFESCDLSYSQYEQYCKTADKFIPYDLFTEGIRDIKSPKEIQCIEKASEIAQSALLEVMPMIKQGVAEREIASELDYRMRKLGGEGNSFDTIAVAGKNSSLVHGEPGDYKIQQGDFVLIDFGCVYKGYCSDMTRTFAVGDISPEMENVYNIVKTAQERALEALKPNALASDIDKIARDVIEEAGYGEFFGHALGHGVGLEIHESPRLSSKSDVILKPGMAVTVEPGIYIPGKFGVRIEDLAVIDEKFHKNLCTKIQKEVIIL